MKTGRKQSRDRLSVIELSGTKFNLGRQRTVVKALLIVETSPDRNRSIRAIALENRATLRHNMRLRVHYRSQSVCVAKRCFDAATRNSAHIQTETVLRFLCSPREPLTLPTKRESPD